MVKFIMLIGPPGSGKSTWAKNYVQKMQTEEPGHRFVILSSMVLNSVKNRTLKILRKLFLITISLISTKAMKWHNFYLILKHAGKQVNECGGIK